LAEELFTSDVAAGFVPFRLRTDGQNWRMPDTMPIDRAANSQELRRDDGQIVNQSLFAPAYRDDFNDYEQQVACYLDSDAAVRWLSLSDYEPWLLTHHHSSTSPRRITLFCMTSSAEAAG
jgi:hypothetical protein